MLFDNASIAVAMYAVAMARRPRNRTFTYGFGRFEVQPWSMSPHPQALCLKPYTLNPTP